MIVLYVLIFIMLIFLSAFFSSSETSIFSINRIRIKHKAKKKKKRAIIINNILKKPDTFFSMILFGNNLVNIAAASISTILVAKIFKLGDELTLIISTTLTTIVILFFAEIIPKTYAYRYSEKMAYLYAYPIRMLTLVFAPFVYIITKISNLFVPQKNDYQKSLLTVEEIKYFLKTEIELFRYNPDVLRMVNEIIDLSSKDIKGIMTPRLDIIAIEEFANIDILKKILMQKKVSKLPVYRKNLDNIIGVLTTKTILSELLIKDIKNIKITDLMINPLFVTEYSSINYVLEEFRKQKNDIAIVLDEYGVNIGILTINDIFREILGEIEFDKKMIRKIAENVFILEGSCTVEELNNRFELDLNESKDYTTISGLFIYHFGKFPKNDDIITIKNCSIKINRMGEKKIEELKLVINEKKGK